MDRILSGRMNSSLFVVVHQVFPLVGRGRSRRRLQLYEETQLDNNNNNNAEDDLDETRICLCVRQMPGHLLVCRSRIKRHDSIGLDGDGPAFKSTYICILYIVERQLLADRVDSLIYLPTPSIYIYIQTRLDRIDR